MIGEFLKISAKNMRRRKLRSWLTVIGIIISIATIFILVSVSLGLNAAVKEQFRQLGSDKFFISPKGQAGGPGSGGSVILSSVDVRSIKKIGGVRSVTYNSLASTKIEFQHQVRFNYVIGIPLDTLNVFSETGFINPDEGRILAVGDSGKVMIGSQYKGSFFKNPVEAGDTLEINNTSFRVKTILKTVGNPQDDKNIFMPLGDFEKLFPEKKDKYDQIVVQVQPGENITDIAEKVTKQLIRSRGLTEKTKDFTILTPEELLATFGTILNILTGFLLGVAAISLVVGGIGIANTMFTSVIERTKEIGVMKAVGARNSDIVKIFTIESGLIGLIGGIGGVIFGFIFGIVLEFVATNQFGTTMLQVSTPWYLFLGSLVFSFLIGAVAGLVPAFRAANVKPVEALRYE